MRYVIDSRYYRGSAVAVFSDDAHNDSEPGETLEMLQQRCKNPHLTAVTPERLSFIQRLRSHTGSEREDRAGRRELAGLLRQLRRNRFRYVFFYGKDEDPLRFFDWLRRNDYTIEVHGTLFRKAVMRIFTATSANTPPPFITASTRGNCFRTSSTNCVP